MAAPAGMTSSSPVEDPRQASFGIVNADRNNPRDIQLGARLTF